MLRLAEKMNGKICLITGATSGVGKATAHGLAELGATVVGVGRDKVKCERASSEIRKVSGNPNIEFLLADLSDQDQVRQLAIDFKARYSKLDVLINNAGAFFLRRKLSAQGIEMTWALNHLCYFLLTNQLLEQIKTSKPARIINVASGAHYRGVIRFDDLNFERRYNGWKAYAQSKLADVSFTYELVRRIEDPSIAINTLTPGMIATRIGQNTGPVLRHLVRLFQSTSGKTPEDGAEIMIYLASAEEAGAFRGKFFMEGVAVRSSAISYDEKVAQRLWEVSERMTGIPFPLWGDQISSN
jgi:NAD(P)-dependent dehydrogenase (short-subunit alcohol dehydrogenase family)